MSVHFSIKKRILRSASFLYPKKRRVWLKTPNGCQENEVNRIEFWKGKDKASPCINDPSEKSVQAFCFGPLLRKRKCRASMTLEAAVILPLFLFAMIAAVQYCSVMGTASRLSCAMTETAKTLANAAYLTVYGGDVGAAGELAGTALTDLWAQQKVMKRAGKTEQIKNANMALSSFLGEDSMIDLVLTYQIKSPVPGFALPGTFFLQRAKVRAWLGNSPGNGSKEGEGEDDEEWVYVTPTGSVYHDDENCTYLKPSVHGVDASELPVLRNRSGSVYHSCEYCGEHDPAGTVYITYDGERYHSDRWCSSIKRTVKKVSKSELDGKRACSKCGHGHDK